MLTEAVALVRSLQSHLAFVLSKVTGQSTRASAYPQPVVTVREVSVVNPEGGSIFIPSSKYAEYVRLVADSDRRYADVRYLSHR